MSAECSNAPSAWLPLLRAWPPMLVLSVPVFSRPSLVPIMGQKTFPWQKGPPLTILLHLSCLFPDELLIWCW